jgi:arylsulfatase A-like enzyme
MPQRIFCLIVASLSALLLTPFAAELPATPNFILIVADDMGYADMSCQGAPFKTPNLDRMAAEGTRFTSFYVAQAVCTASRAALMSGCYPNRVGLQGALNHTSLNGIHPDEFLMPEMFKARGYATAGMGKWHLGTRPNFFPTRHGFDEWTGIPYSNDNSKYHPVLAAEMPPLPWFDGEKVIETDPDQSQFTRRLTERAVSFIDRNSSRPFFLYLAHIMPHVPIFASAKFKDKSGVGLYPDVIQELDWSVGEVLAALKRHKIDEKTLVIFISDNGPFLSYGDHAGSAAPLRGGKLTTFEGGMRVPFLARWPGQIPTGRVSDVPFMGFDLLPTLTELVGGQKSTRKIDGASLKPLLLGESNAKSPHDAYFFYSGTELHAVRSGDWKLHFPHPYLSVMAEPGHDGKPSGWGKLTPVSIEKSGVEGIASRHGYKVEKLELSLYNVKIDPAESHNVAAEHPDLVQKLSALADPIRRELGDSLRDMTGSETREAGLDKP